MTAIVTRDMLKAFRADMDAAMKAVYDKHGLIGTLGKITFSENSFSGKIEATLKSGLPASVTSSNGCNVNFNTVFVKGVERHGYSYGSLGKPVTVEKLGKKFIHAGLEYTFMGINQTGHFAIGMQTRNGKSYKIRPAELQAAKWVD